MVRVKWWVVGPEVTIPSCGEAEHSNLWGRADCSPHGVQGGGRGEQRAEEKRGREGERQVWRREEERGEVDREIQRKN